MNNYFRIISYLLKWVGLSRFIKGTEKYTVLGVAALSALSSGYSVYGAVNSGGDQLQLLILGIIGFLFAVGIAFCYMYIKSRLRKINETFANITALLLNNKFNELVLTFPVYLVVTWLIYAFDRLDLAWIVVFFALAQIITFGLTFFRIATGRFGYNTLEMKEIAQFVSASKRGNIPPNVGGLRKSPLETESTTETATDFGGAGVK